MRVGIIGAGPAGLMAAISAADKGWQVSLIEQNKDIGCKLLISGGGRCNITNTLFGPEFLERFREYGRFFKPAFMSFSNEDAIRFFEENGLALKEEDGRIFPASGKAKDVVDFFRQQIAKRSISTLLGNRVYSLEKEGDMFVVYLRGMGPLTFDRLIVATGGASFSSKCCTDGRSFDLLRKMGHTITELIPHLCSLNTEEDLVSLKGITIKDVVLRHTCPLHKLVERGSIIFTHDGISGPAVHNISRFLLTCRGTLNIDLLPSLDFERLREKVVGLFQDHPKRSLRNIVNKILPDALVVFLLASLDLPLNKKVTNLSRSEVHRLVSGIKFFPLKIASGPPLEWAFVTHGGVDVREVNPNTIESRIVKGMYFAGEVLEPSGPTGGFNIQFALSTGFLAGQLR